MTPFERALRVRELWPWLPVFRVVAETEHLPTASDVLHVSASALSRTIRLLEAEVKEPLFDRRGRSLQLNAAGQVLLLRVRDAMRLMDEALEELAGGNRRGTVRLSVTAPLAAVGLVDALETLELEAPGLVPELVSETPARINDALRSGSIDLALSEIAEQAADIAIEELAQFEHRIWCGKQHARVRGRSGMDQLLKSKFVVATDHGSWRDPWPPHLERRVGLRVSEMQAAIDACSTGNFLVVLPETIAAHGGLHRVNVPFCERTSLYLIRRPPLPVRGRIDLVADAVHTWAAGLRGAWR